MTYFHSQLVTETVINPVDRYIGAVKPKFYLNKKKNFPQKGNMRVIFYARNENCGEIHDDLPGDKIHRDKRETLYLRLSSVDIVQEKSQANPKLIERYQNILYGGKTYQDL